MVVKVLVSLFTVAVVVAVGLSLDARSRPPARQEVAAPASYAIHAAGRVEGAAPEVELRTQLSGRVAAVLVHEGQEVGAGDALLRLDDDAYRQDVELAVADVETAEAQLARLVNGAHARERGEAAAMHRAKLAELKRARLSWERIQRLRDDRAISQQEADDQSTLVETLTAQVEAAKARVDFLESPARQDEVRMAKARIHAAQAKLESAKVQLRRTELRAPCAGTILRCQVEAGELTGPQTAEPAVVMADTSRYHVRAYVEELDAPRVRLGMTTTATADGLANRKFTGRVTRLSPRMGRKQIWNDHPAENLDSKMREVWIALDHADDLVVGLRVNVVIDPTRSDNERRTTSNDVQSIPSLRP